MRPISLLVLAGSLLAGAELARAESHEDGVAPPKRAAKPADGAPPVRSVQLQETTLDLSDTRDLGAPVCWSAPPRLARKRLQALARAMVEAGIATRPPHTRQEVVELSPQGKRTSLAPDACAVVLKLSLTNRRKGEAELSLAVEDPRNATPLSLSALIDPDAPDASSLSAAWRTVWERVAPAPAPPPPVAQEPEVPFVDEDLIRAQHPPPPLPPPRGPRWVKVFVDAGLLSRSIDGAPGTAVRSSGLLSLGIEGIIHVDRLAGVDGPHRIDLGAGYWRRLARGTLGDAEIGVDVDRLLVGAEYRYAIGAGLPSVGVLAGFELLRFEVDPSANAISARYGVIRAGLAARHAILDGELGLDALLAGALRLSAGADQGSPGAGFDLGGGLELSTLEGLLRVRGVLRYARQPAELGGAELSDRYFDLNLGVGVAL
ncbi:MAG: hypothetical protein IT384_21765 [Deltaproteobacteria bacterium]|nr:hypothetical protein [Deltaproteobacteria bacterium]